MRVDSIFWIASMSKPITATAVLMLMEEGKLSLDDPIAKYVPELAGLKTADGKTPRITLRRIGLGVDRNLPDSPKRGRQHSLQGDCVAADCDLTREPRAKCDDSWRPMSPGYSSQGPGKCWMGDSDEPPVPASKKFVALQIGARSFVDEGVDKCPSSLCRKEIASAHLPISR